MLNVNDKSAATFPLTLSTMDPGGDDNIAWQVGIVSKGYGQQSKYDESNYDTDKYSS